MYHLGASLKTLSSRLAQFEKPEFTYCKWGFFKLGV